jgi:hypothetical protein
MAVWSIKIVEGENPGDPAEFVPQLQPGGPQGLLAQLNDLVSWNNKTDEVHEPWPTDDKFKPLTMKQIGPSGSPNYMSDEINPGKSSRPSWRVVQPVLENGHTIYYCCKLHKRERGIITITD